MEFFVLLALQLLLLVGCVGFNGAYLATSNKFVTLPMLAIGGFINSMSIALHLVILAMFLSKK